MEDQFTKEQLARCRDFRGRRDLVEALLEEGRSYTKAEANRIIQTFLKGKGN
ncbi:MAG: hypothetical protein AB7E30_05335 [Lawsonibacter sp.]